MTPLCAAEGRQGFTFLPPEAGILKCALCADFWLRYARYLEPKDVPAAKDAVRRGQLIHCKGISRDAALCSALSRAPR